MPGPRSVPGQHCEFAIPRIYKEPCYGDNFSASPLTVQFPLPNVIRQSSHWYPPDGRTQFYSSHVSIPHFSPSAHSDLDSIGPVVTVHLSRKCCNLFSW